MSLLRGLRRLFAAYAPAPAFEPRYLRACLLVLPGLLAPGQPRAEPARELTLDVLTYNVFLLPVIPDSQSLRAPLMADELKGFDVVLLQEAYSDRHRDMVLRGLADDYPYRSQVLGRDRWLKQDGGVVILSRWPIETERELLFGSLCEGRDCWADKGALYARINKEGRRIHVFATHLQSGSDARPTRERQMAGIRALIDELALPEAEPVLIGGDLNTDRFSDRATGAFTRMLAILGAVQPDPPSGGTYEPTYDPERNPLSRGWRGRHIDYVLYAAGHLRPAEAFTEVRRIAADVGPLSDHFAVRGRFLFTLPEPLPAN
jgi:endonuclease/exonuclease/phosphatase family metal-dependent hydrolase